ncbi:hypothetical protein HID58_070333 [Brassica napus]|uniref:Uncharacterized protein n=1 Tax=Brassica napus TaxID=3708 RepID=A0ABQ7YYH0_BRANA|nr:hypothetical protein HID58_070333 [Brassica napus]
MTLSTSSDDDSAHDQLIDRTLQCVSLLLESAKRCFRKRLTLQFRLMVFSMLDIKSLIKLRLVAPCLANLPWTLYVIPK